MRRLLVALALAGSACAQDRLRPRIDEDLPERIAGYERDGAAARLLRILDNRDTVDVFLGTQKPNEPLRGARAAARDAAARLCARSATFREEWEAAAAKRRRNLGDGAPPWALADLASRFRGTATSREAWREVAERAMEAGDLAEAAQAWARAGLPRSAEEALRRARCGESAAVGLAKWEATRALGIGPGALGRLIPWARGAALQVPRPRRRDPWHGERNAFDLPFPALAELGGVEKVRVHARAGAVRIQKQVLFEEPGLYVQGSPIRLLPVGDVVWAAIGEELLELKRGGNGWAGASADPGVLLTTASASADAQRVYGIAAENGPGGKRLLTAWRRDGTVEWVRGLAPAEDSEDPLDLVEFSGPPLLHSGRLYVPISLFDVGFSPGLACIEASTGRTIWVTPVAESMRFVNATSILRAAAPPSTDGERLYLLTNQGYAAALDAATGDPEWIFAYPDLRGVFPNAWVGGPPRIAGRHVLFGPIDSARGFVLEGSTGRLARDLSPTQDGLYAHALSDGRRFVLAGAVESEDRLGVVKVLNLDGGRDVTYELPDPVLGRGAIGTDGRLYLPATKGLYALDLDSGALSVVQEWGAADAGDLVRIPGWVAVVGSEEVRFREVKK